MDEELEKLRQEFIRTTNVNIADSEEYLKQREALEKYYNEDNVCSLRKELFGDYELIVKSYRMPGDGWNFAKGLVFQKKKNPGHKDDYELLFIIERNYSEFWQCWVKHSNGNTYLLCGEDYQGYVVLNLTKRTKHVYYPQGALKGIGFCWAQVEYDEELNQLEVTGCYWGAPYEVVIYDFSNPEELPLKEISREYEYEEYNEEDENE